MNDMKRIPLLAGDEEAFAGAPDDEKACHQVIGVFYGVYNALGFGFPEAVYARAMEMDLIARGLRVVREARMQVTFRGEVIGEFRADLLVEDCLILELKAASRLTQGDEFQLINYLRATGIRLGLLMLSAHVPSFGVCYAQVLDVAGKIRFIPVIRFMVVVNVLRERTRPYADR